jgi:hypothetical protein
MAQQTGNLSGTERAVSALCGLSFSLIALRGGSPVWRLLNGVAGAALLARAWMSSPAAARTTGRAAALDPTGFDAVDRSVMDSFPASDPPASRLPDEPPSNAQAKWESARSSGKT